MVRQEMQKSRMAIWKKLKLKRNIYIYIYIYIFFIKKDTHNFRWKTLPEKNKSSI